MLIRYGTDKNGRPVKKALVYTKEEHKIPKSRIDFEALQIIDRLRNEGFHAYLVGGAVRDLIVGNSPKDFDIVTDATPTKIKRIFRNSRIIGRRFRIVHVVYGEKIYEVSTFRSIAEGSVGNEFGTIDEDVQRRDFSMNALYYDPVQEHVIDYVGGVKDIRKGILRPVIPLDRIFVEDPVRMLRAIKYSAKTKSKMSFIMRRKIRQNAGLLAQVSPSRLTEELLKIINSGNSSAIIAEALDTDLYMSLQPAATGMMYANKSFESKYMVSMKQLDDFIKAEPDARLGQKLIFMIRDFILSLTDWKKELENHTPYAELYAKTWRECRNFVLPMNPQRTELDFAIRSVLTELGVPVKTRKKKAPAQKNAEQPKKKSSKGRKRAETSAVNSEPAPVANVAENPAI